MRSRHSIGSLFRRHSRTTLIVVSVVLLLLVVLRALLPSLVLSQVNQRLAQLDGFHGHVDDIDMALWRGAYELDGVSFSRVVDGGHEPILEVGEIDFSLSWSTLFQGRIRSGITATDLAFIYVPVEEEAQTADLDQPDWRDVITDLFPIDIEHLNIHRGRVEYRDLEAEPPVDVSLENIELRAAGLSNRAVGAERLDQLPAQIRMTGTTIGGGSVNARVAAAPLADAPLFDLDLAIENVALPALNDYLRAYGNVDVSEGTLHLFTEISAREGRFEGYIKPLADNVSFRDVEGQSDKGLLSETWEGIVSIVTELFENQPRDQVGTRIPIAGEFGQAETGLWAALGNLFRHGFIRALTERIEGQSLDEETPDTPRDGE